MTCTQQNPRQQQQLTLKNQLVEHVAAGNPLAADELRALLGLNTPERLAGARRAATASGFASGVTAQARCSARG